MHAIDPNLLLIANGQLRVWQANRIIDQGGQHDWNEKLVRENREKVHSISVHSLPGGHLTKPDDPIGVWKDLLAYADNYPDFLNDLIVEPMKKEGLKPLVAITELQSFTKHSALPKENNWGGALWYSAMLNQCIRSGDLVELITHSALLNHGGGLKKNRGIVFADPVWWVTHLYSTQRGIIPVAIKIESPTFSSSGRYIVKRDSIPYIDGIALIDSVGETCTVMLANRHETLPVKIELFLKNFNAAKDVEVSQLHSDKLSKRNTWQYPKEIYADYIRLPISNGLIKYELPPLSFMRLIFFKDIKEI
jgi:alpha-N-arabinofuranosidase